jgi:hypothetical protein
MISIRNNLWCMETVKVQALRILWRRGSENLNATMKQSANDALTPLWEMDALCLEARTKMIENRLKPPLLILETEPRQPSIQEIRKRNFELSIN